MTLWQNKKVAAIYNIEVEYDLIKLKRQLNQVFPDEKELRVIRTNDSITLSGQISSASNLAQARASPTMSPDGRRPPEPIRILVT